MENIKFKFIAGLAACCVIASSQPAACAAGYEELSAQLLGCAENNTLRKIAVLEFSAKGGAGKSDAEYAAEKIELNLAGSKKTALIERALLERVMKENRLSTVVDGMADKAGILRNMLSLDAVITGTVFPDGEKLRVLARIIELKTGRVLLAAEAEVARLPVNLIEGNFSGMELPEIPFLEPPASWHNPAPAAARTELRDAVADNKGPSCPGKRRLLGKLNAELVDAKAWYWADKMKTPGFRRDSLTRNPGSEISDSGVKARFYKLLSAYYEAGTSVSPDAGKLSSVSRLMAMEKQVSNECGVN